MSLLRRFPRTPGARKRGQVQFARRARRVLCTKRGKGDRYNLPGGPAGCYAQIVPVPFSVLFRFVCLLLALLPLGAPSLRAAELLEGEFDSIDLGRRLLEPSRFPTVAELREAVARPELSVAVMFKLFGGQDNHHLPVFSGDGLRLAFQRSDVAAKSSKLLLFASLSQDEPTMLTDEESAYDYMFRWTLNSPASYSFVRIDPGRTATRVFFTPGGKAPEEHKGKSGRHRFPASYFRTDGIWRLLYERDGRLLHEAWDDKGPIEQPFVLAQATSPCWSDDGRRVLAARIRSAESRTPDYEIVVRDMRSGTDTVLSAAEDTVVRSPTWSPDGEAAAFYVRALGETAPWRIRVVRIDGGSSTLLGEDVVVNPNFESQGPAWEPGGRRIWFFSHAHQREAYYPMVAGEVATGRLAVIDYPNRCTTPADLAINAADPVPEIAFVAHDGLPKDLFIVFLNHY